MARRSVRKLGAPTGAPPPHLKLRRVPSHRRAVVRSGEPLTEMVGGFVGGWTVERHQRRGHPRNSDDVGSPPSLGDRRHLDLVLVASDQFLKPTNGCAHRCHMCNNNFGGEACELYASARGTQAKGPSKIRAHAIDMRFSGRAPRGKNISVARSTGNAPFLNSFSTSSVALTARPTIA